MMFNTAIISLSGCNFDNYAVGDMSLYFPQEDAYRHFFANPDPKPIENTADISTDWYHTMVFGGIGATEHIPGALPLITI